MVYFYYKTPNTSLSYHVCSKGGFWQELVPRVKRKINQVSDFGIAFREGQSSRPRDILQRRAGRQQEIFTGKGRSLHVTKFLEKVVRP